MNIQYKNNLYTIFIVSKSAVSWFKKRRNEVQERAVLASRNGGS